MFRIGLRQLRSRERAMGLGPGGEFLCGSVPLEPCPEGDRRSINAQPQAKKTT